MRKLFLLTVCCLCLCGCGKERITICTYHNKDFPDNEHIITIKHIKNKITYYKNEYKTKYKTITEAQNEVDSFNKDLICSDKDCYSSLEGEGGAKYTIYRENKTVINIQEFYNYEDSYNDELKMIEDLASYTCNEQ